MSFLIQTQQLTKYYSNGKVKALHELDLEVKEGEVFGYIGPNGAGKTTTIRLLLDLIRPTKGTAKIFGLDINQKSVIIKRDLGFLPGEIYLQENITGKQCINYFAGFKKEKADKKYLKHLLDRFGLDIDKKIKDYSKGNKQKLAIVLAFMHKPRLLILDEPTSGLDPLNQQEFYSLIKSVKADGATVLLSTHLLFEAEKVCDRVGIIKDGKLLAIEKIDDFREKNIRIINLEVGETIPLESLKSIKGIRKVTRTTTGYNLVSSGKNGQVIKELARFGADDFKINEPSLEDIFLHFYK